VQSPPALLSGWFLSGVARGRIVTAKQSSYDILGGTKAPTLTPAKIRAWHRDKPVDRRALTRVLSLVSDEIEPVSCCVEAWAELYMLNALNVARATVEKRTPSVQRDEVRNIATTAQALLDQLKNADAVIMICEAALDWESLLAQLQQLRDTARATAARTVPAGKPPDDAYKWFLGELRALFESRTGKKASDSWCYNQDSRRYEGPFIALVEICLPHIHERYGIGMSANNTAIGKYLERHPL
jgi:hypothetical protein